MTASNPTSLATQAGRFLVRTGSLASIALASHAAVNLTLMPAIAPRPSRVSERVSILVPARNEAHRIAPTIRSLLAQRGMEYLEILILDDGSSDGTSQVVQDIAADDDRLRVIAGADEDPPAGWIGKPWACQRLAEAATGTVLVFVDADVELDPDAVAATVTTMRERGLDLISPIPHQAAVSVIERLTQPLLNWAWLSLVPLPLVTGTPFGTWAAAIGQFLVVDATAYRLSGGHEMVKDKVVEDLAFAQEFKRRGFIGLPAIGADVATCRMYDDGREVFDGYTKSLWSLFPGWLPMSAAVAATAITFVLPMSAAVGARDRRTRTWGAVGFAAAVTGRAIISKRVGERTWPDALAHPLSVTTMMSFAVASRARLRDDLLRWKGRRVVADYEARPARFVRPIRSKPQLEPR